MTRGEQAPFQTMSSLGSLFSPQDRLACTDAITKRKRSLLHPGADCERGTFKAVKMASSLWARQAVEKGSCYINTNHKLMCWECYLKHCLFFFPLKQTRPGRGTAGLGQHPVGLHASSICLWITAAFPSVCGVSSHTEILIIPQQWSRYHKYTCYTVLLCRAHKLSP